MFYNISRNCEFTVDTFHEIRSTMEDQFVHSDEYFTSSRFDRGWVLHHALREVGVSSFHFRDDADSVLCVALCGGFGESVILFIFWLLHVL